ncbi:hypothetical protein AMELA_G00242150 [Ameiurus melas]|uniref:Ig-like domain-containing protein n=1 Tax=Ameiurus melas TaxID=219545 RepID=A0A7J5ZYA9_AMEME|nr:hypothetical protein AMELA_G00242150 [Ameiurus melas]
MKDNTVMLKLLLFLTFSLLSSADTHTLQYLYTAVRPGIKFTAVGLVDGKQFVFYDINMTRISEWMKKAEADDPDYSKEETERVKNQQDSLQNIVTTVMKSFNQSEVPPTASVFQKHSSSPEVVCHATGFFPKTVMITWQKDGEDVHEDVDLRETLPNQDGSFQKRSILTVSAEDLQKHTYTCVIQHSSLEKEIVLPVRDLRILNPGQRNTFL